MFDKSLNMENMTDLSGGRYLLEGRSQHRTGDYESAKNDYIEFMGIPVTWRCLNIFWCDTISARPIIIWAIIAMLSSISQL